MLGLSLGCPAAVCAQASPAEMDTEQRARVRVPTEFDTSAAGRLSSPTLPDAQLSERLGGAYTEAEPPTPADDEPLLRALGASWAGAGIGAAFGIGTALPVGALLCIDAEPSTCFTGLLAGLLTGASVGLLTGASAGVVRSLGRSAVEGLALLGVTSLAASALATPLIAISFATSDGGSLASAIAVPLAAVPFLAPLLAAALFGEEPANVAPSVTPTEGGATLGAVGVF
ncbi:MAG: hypothetical protein AB8I08_21730 [Sandaracinaceae bacterium]